MENEKKSSGHAPEKDASDVFRGFSFCFKAEDESRGMVNCTRVPTKRRLHLSVLEFKECLL